MRALLAEQAGERARLVDRAPPVGGLVLAAAWSGVNYKDALAVTGRPGVLRSLPLVPGIDVAGTAPDGRELVVTGSGLGERIDGAFAEQVAVDPTSAIPVPRRFGLRGAATIGTAGVTAALAALELTGRGLPDGPVLVTGAGGGVGGFAIALLSAAGYEVHAATGRADRLADHLRALGAAEVVDRLEAAPGRPMQRARWAGVVDSIGGGALVNAVAQTRPAGVVAACGLAASADLPGSVLPFILRGVTLTGIFSVDIGAAAREAAWNLLAERLDDVALERMVERTVGLDGVAAVADDVLAGRVRGRVLVDLSA